MEKKHNTKTRHLLEEVEALKFKYLKIIIYFQKNFWNQSVWALGTDSGDFPRCLEASGGNVEHASIRMRVEWLPKPWRLLTGAASKI